MAGIRIDIDSSAAQRAAQQLRRELRNLGSSAADNEADFGRLERRLRDGMSADRAERSLDSLRRSLNMTRTETARFQASLGDYSGAFRTMTQGIKGATVAMGALGVAMSGLALKSMISQGIAFESTMKAVQAVSRASADDFKMLSAAAREMGATTEWSAQQSGEALKFMAMAGMSTADSITALPGLLNLATAAQMDLATASDIATDTLTAFGLKTHEMSRLNDALINTSTRANTTVSMLGEAFKKVAPVAANMGYSVENASAMLGVLANSGIKAESAGVVLRQALLRTGKAAKNLGMDIDSSLLDVLSEMKARQYSVNDVVKEFGIIASTGVTILMNNVEAVNKLNFALDTNRGATQAVALIMRDSLDNSLKILKSTVSDLALEMFTLFGADLKGMVDGITIAINDNKEEFIKLAESFKDMSTAARKFIETKLPEYLNNTLAAISALNTTIDAMGGKNLTMGVVGLYLFGPKGAATLYALSEFNDLLAKVNLNIGSLSPGKFNEEMGSVLQNIADVFSGKKDWNTGELKAGIDELSDSLGTVTGTIDKNTKGWELYKKTTETVKAKTGNITESIKELSESAIKANLNFSNLGSGMESSLIRHKQAMDEFADAYAKAIFTPMELESKKLDGLYNKYLRHTQNRNAVNKWYAIEKEKLINKSLDAEFDAIDDLESKYIDEYLRDKVKTEEEAAKATADMWTHMITEIQDTFSDSIYQMLDGNLDSFEDFFDSVLDMFKKMAAQMIGYDLVSGIFGSGVAGEGTGFFTGGSGNSGILGNLSDMSTLYKGASYAKGLWGSYFGAQAATPAASAASTYGVSMTEGSLIASGSSGATAAGSAASTMSATAAAGWIGAFAALALGIKEIIDYQHRAEPSMWLRSGLIDESPDIPGELNIDKYGIRTVTQDVKRTDANKIGPMFRDYITGALDYVDEQINQSLADIFQSSEVYTFEAQYEDYGGDMEKMMADLLSSTFTSVRESLISDLFQEAAEYTWTERDWHKVGEVKSSVGGESERDFTVTDLMKFTDEQKTGSVADAFFNEEFFTNLQSDGESLWDTYIRFENTVSSTNNFLDRFTEQTQNLGVSTQQAFLNLELITTTIKELAASAEKFSKTTLIQNLEAIDDAYTDLSATLKALGATSEELEKVNKYRSVELGSATTGFTADSFADALWTAIQENQNAESFVSSLEDQIRIGVAQTMVNELSAGIFNAFISPINAAIGNMVSQLILGGSLTSATLQAGVASITVAIEAATNLLNNSLFLDAIGGLYDAAENIYPSSIHRPSAAHLPMTTPSQYQEGTSITTARSEFTSELDKIIKNSQGTSEYEQAIDELNKWYAEQEITAKRLGLTLEKLDRAYAVQKQTIEDIEMEKLVDAMAGVKDAISKTGLSNYKKTLIEISEQTEKNISIISALMHTEEDLNGIREWGAIQTNKIMEESVKSIDEYVRSFNNLTDSMNNVMDSFDSAVKNYLENVDAAIDANVEPELMTSAIKEAMKPLTMGVENFFKAAVSGVFTKTQTELVRITSEASDLKTQADFLQKSFVELDFGEDSKVMHFLKGLPTVIDAFSAIQISALHSSNLSTIGATKAAIYGMEEQWKLLQIGSRYNIDVQTQTEQRSALDATLNMSADALLDMAESAGVGVEQLGIDMLFLDSVLKKTADKFKKLIESLDDYQDQLSLSDRSPLDPAQKYSIAQAAFLDTVARSQSADPEIAMKAMGELQGVSNDFLDASKAYNVDLFKYKADFGQVLAVLDQSQAYAKDQIDIVEDENKITEKIAENHLAELTALNSQIGFLDGNIATFFGQNTFGEVPVGLGLYQDSFNLFSIEFAGYVTFMDTTYFEKMGTLFADLSAKLGADISGIRTIQSPLTEYEAEQPDETILPYVEPGTKYEYSTPELKGGSNYELETFIPQAPVTVERADDYWAQFEQDPATILASKYGATAEDYRGKIGQDALDWYNTATATDIARAASQFGLDTSSLIADFNILKEIQGFANGGDTDGGPYFVGEKGIELMNTGPARIHSNTDTIKMLASANAGLEAKIEILNDKLSKLNRLMFENVVATKNTFDILDKFDEDGVPAERSA